MMINMRDLMDLRETLIDNKNNTKYHDDGSNNNMRMMMDAIKNESLRQ